MAFQLVDVTALHAQLPTAPLSQIADEIRRDWRNPSPYAVPYIAALLQCPTIDSTYGVESAKDIVLYFLSNAGTWRGPKANLIKAELKRRLRNTNGGK